MKILRITVIALAATLFFACSNDLDSIESQQNDFSVTTAKTIVNTSNLSGFADEILTDLLDPNESGKYGKSFRNDECFSSERSGLTTTITFNNCEIGNGEIVNGELSATYTFNDENIGLSITYTDLTIGQVSLSGTREIQFQQSNDMGRTTILVDSDIELGFEDNSIVLEEGSKIIRYETDSEAGNLISIDGEWSVTTDGRTYDVVIEDNLETTLPCEFISKGLMLITENEAKASLDFGDGTCDDKAIFTYPNGDTEEITL